MPAKKKVAKKPKKSTKKVATTYSPRVKKVKAAKEKKAKGYS